MRVAESILFAGKAVRVLRNPTTNFRLQESFMCQLVLKGSSRVQSYIGNFSSQREVSPAMNLIAEDLLPQSEADKIDAMLKELKVFPPAVNVMFISFLQIQTSPHAKIPVLSILKMFYSLTLLSQLLNFLFLFYILCRNHLSFRKGCLNLL